MKVAIVEICEPNHYTAVEALALTYASEPGNEVRIYTLATFKILESLTQRENILLQKKNNKQNITRFLLGINNVGFDVIHVNTISKHYSQFAAVNWKNLVLTVHNIDIWFDNPLIKQIALLKYRLKNTKGGIKQWFYLPIKYFFREYLWQKERAKMVCKIIKKKQKVLVYSNNQKKFLSKYLTSDQIIVFPFCVRQPSEDLSVNNKCLRVCIPGSVNNHRRDYDGLFQLLKEHHQNYAHRICIDLLGYIPKTENHIIPQIEELKKLGIQIIYNQNFIDADTFNLRLQLCDIVFGNLKPNLNQQSKYGETKETGVIFNMIKAAKPGIFPDTYPIDKSLQSICLTYHNDLHALLLGLLTDNAQIYDLKQRALEITKQYEPKNLYPKLIAQLNN